MAVKKDLTQELNAVEDNFQLEDTDVIKDTSETSAGDTPVITERNPEQAEEDEKVFLGAPEKDTAETKTDGSLSDEDFLKALKVDPEEEGDEDKEKVLAVFDKVAAQAKEKNWDSEELTNLLGMKSTIEEYVREIDTREQQIVAKDRELAQRAAIIEAEFAEVLQHVGLDINVFKARNWPSQLISAFAAKYNTGTESDDDTFDDVPMTRKEVREYLAKQQNRTNTQSASAAPSEKDELLRRIQAMEDRERQQQQYARDTKDVQAAYTHYFQRQPFFKELAKQRPGIINDIYREGFNTLGDDLPTLLGKDRTGLEIRRKIDAYARRVQTINSAALKPPETKKNVQLSKKGRPAVGDTQKIERPKLVTETGGRRVHRSISDAVDEMDEQFDKSLGL